MAENMLNQQILLKAEQQSEQFENQIKTLEADIAQFQLTQENHDEEVRKYADIIKDKDVEIQEINKNLQGALKKENEMKELLKKSEERILSEVEGKRKVEEEVASVIQELK